MDIESDFHEALNNWGSALLAQAKMKTGDEADALFAQAGERLAAAETLSPGAAAYNLACLCSLRQDANGCKNWLMTARKLGSLPAKEHVEADTDLDSVRGEDWFQRFLADL